MLVVNNPTIQETTSFFHCSSGYPGTKVPNHETLAGKVLALADLQITEHHPAVRTYLFEVVVALPFAGPDGL